MYIYALLLKGLTSMASVQNVEETGTEGIIRLKWVIKLIPVAALFEAWVCGPSLAGIVGSIPMGGMDACLLWVLFIVTYRSLRRADHSSRGVLLSVVCNVSAISKPLKGSHDTDLGWGATRKKKRIFS